MWGTIGTMPTFFGMVPKAIEQHDMPYRIVSECWPGANVIGKVPIPAIYCSSHFSPLEEGLGVVGRRHVLLTCDYVATSEASSGSEMRGVRNSHPYILFRFPVVSVLLTVCHD